MRLYQILRRLTIWTTVAVVIVIVFQMVSWSRIPPGTPIGPEPGPMGVPWGLIGVSEAIALACAVHLWRGNWQTHHKLFWSVVLPVPFFGPVLFGALGRPLRPLPDEMQSHGDGYGNQGGNGSEHG